MKQIQKQKQKQKGQVSTEYLIILAVVLIVALVVVYLIGGFSGAGAGVLESQSRSYWVGVASPFAIKNAKIAGTSMQLDMLNQDQEKLTVTDISVAGASVFSTSTVYNAAEQKVVTATLSATCGAAGVQYSYENVTVTYTRGSLSGNKQVGTKALVGRCA